MVISATDFSVLICFTAFHTLFFFQYFISYEYEFLPKEPMYFRILALIESCVPGIALI